MTPKMKILTRVVAPVAVVAVALVCAGAMMALSPKAERTTPSTPVTVVTTLQVQPQPVPTEIQATGTTEPSKSITVIPQVSGKVVATHPNLVPGGRVAKGEVILQIDRREYAAALEQERARAEGSEVEYQLEVGRAQIAREEWTLLRDSQPSSEAPLAVREPQLAVAEQNMRGAQGARDRAELLLQRTTIRAPFDAIVREENVDVGQVVGPASSVASLMSADALHVQCSLPAEQLQHLRTGTSEAPGSSAQIVQRFGDGSRATYSGFVRETFGELDSQTRRARVLVEVPHPREADVPLLPGAFVDVTLEGPLIDSAVQLPQTALHDGAYVWLAKDQKLTRRAVEVGWRHGDQVTIIGGLTEGDTVITSPLALPIEGMPVQEEGVAEASDGE